MFEEMPDRNIITWNSMISGFCSNDQIERAFDLFVRMHSCGFGFDQATLVSVIVSCPQLYHFIQLHSLVIKSGLEGEVGVATALVRAYSILGCSIGECYKAFEAVREQDVISWTGVIASCADQEPCEALRFFCKFRAETLEPDRYTFSAVIKACAGFATELHCSSLHSLILRYGFWGDIVLSNALIHAYARSGSIRLAERVFEEMKVHDLVSWNSIIKAYAAHGKGRRALHVFSRMDIRPDSATFVGLLTACSHGGLVNEGQDLFNSMSESYGIFPQLDHYACMVDILGRAGKVLEAENCINSMSMEPDSVIWSALLASCRKHGKIKIAEKAARKLVELDPRSSAGYTVMYNLYCSTGCFDDASSFRKVMKVAKVMKDPGLSWVEIGRFVHEFSVGALHHPQREEIYLQLGILVKEVKELGYVPQTRLVFHEVEEEHKEERLLHHSEKLALAFSLMVSSISQADLRIMKNIRICEDCHNFIRFVSTCIKKEILVRDPVRFHHFNDGLCSCGDYW